MLFVAASIFTACPNNAGGSGGNSGGSGTPTVQTYTVELDHTIGGNVAVTPALSEDGMVTGMVAENIELTFTAEPLGGYDLEKWELNGEAVNGTELTYTHKVTANARVKVFFKRNSGLVSMRSVTITPPQHGRIRSVPEIPSDNQVPEGSIIILTAVPDAGYGVNRWSVTPEGELTAGGTAGSSTATLSVSNDVTVTVTFGNVIFGVDGGHGTLKAEVDSNEITSPAHVEQDKVVVFTASPNEGYTVDTWTITGGQLLTGGSPGVSTAMVKITDPVTVAVSFKLKPPTTYAVIFGTAGTPANGSVSAKYKADGAAFTSGTAVPANTVLAFTASPAADYKVEKWTVNGTAVPGNTSDTYEHTVTQAADIRVSFVSSVAIPDTFTLANGAEYEVVDKEQKHVIMTERENDAGGTVYTVAVTVEYSGITYTLIDFKENCMGGLNLTAVALSGPSDFLSVDGGVLFNKAKTKLICYPTNKAGTSYTVPPSVKVLVKYSFSGSDNLTSLILSEGLTTIENFALYACQKLKTVYIPSSLTSIGSHFLGASKVEDVKIPEGVTKLGGQFLDNCSALKTLELPSTFTSPHYEAFCDGCTALQTVTCKAVSPPVLQSNAFKDVILSGVTLKVPSDSISNYETAAVWKDFKKPFVALP
ncbi:leucine-rich repeat protein [Treponema socranskii]|uniref:leucine-rich repeat protein n=1 Tax=Treponema socranskii TaxID=53419 RepID=UPI003D93CB2D